MVDRVSMHLCRLWRATMYVWHIGVAFHARGYAMLSVADMDGMGWLVLREAWHNWFTLIPSRYVKTVFLAALWVFGHMPCTLDLQIPSFSASNSFRSKCVLT